MDSRLLLALRRPVCPGPADPATHVDPIELSNTCRAFYQARLEAARGLRERWGTVTARSTHPEDAASAASTSDKNENCRKQSSIDVAIEKLRREMTSLMEQDLSLMRQLLTLNEEIEELKWRRRCCWSRTSIMTSSGDVDLGSLASVTSSEASLSWWRESGELPLKYPGISSLSLQAAEHNRLSVYDEEDPMGTFNRHTARARGSQRTLPNTCLGVVPEQLQQKLQESQQKQQQCLKSEAEENTNKDATERESLDSGIHEGYTDTSLQCTNSLTEMTHL